MAWTAKQSQAIEENGELLVSAAAGSGKTAVLTERIARHILEGAKTDEILCVTFTNAAAGEMKHRLEGKLSQLASELEKSGLENGASEAKRLREAALAVPRANISTLHAFCAQMLRRHFSLVDLDPSFSILDDAEAEVMKLEAADEMLESRYGSGTRFYELVLGLGGESEFIKLILNLHSFMNAQIDPMGFLDRAADIYKTASASDTGGMLFLALSEVADDVKSAIDPLLGEAERILDLLAAQYPGLEQNPGGEFALLRHALSCDFEGMASDLKAHAQPRRFSFRRTKGMELSDYEMLKLARDKLRAEVKRQRDKLDFSLADEMALLNAQAPLIDELKECMRVFIDAFSEAKRRKNAIDYDDMEHFALKLLSREVIAREYQRRFKFIFVDEYQDTNRVQEKLISRMKREDNLFVVGDVKQSIYSFRMADPTIFLEKMAQCGAGHGTRIDLSANFRSSKAVIDAVNGVFSRTMTSDTAGIAYDENAALHFGREPSQTPPSAELGVEAAFRLDNGDCELDIIDASGADALEAGSSDAETAYSGAKAPDSGDEAAGGDAQAADSGVQAAVGDEAADGDDDEPPEKLRLEAAFAARRIRELMANEFIIDSATRTPRKLKYSDFAVLLRSHRTAAGIWLEELSLAGIPAYAQLSGGYFDAIEVRVFIDLLRIIDNRRQSIPLLAVMRSPICDFSAEELGELRMTSQSEEWIDILLEYTAAPDENASALKEKCAAFLAKLDYWYYQLNLMSVEQLIGALLDETGYLDYCGALPGGDARRRNLIELLNRARAYERSGVSSLHSFIDFLDKLKNTDKLGTSETLGADVVRILSIHKSKGLEFPVVIIASLDKQFNYRSANAAMLLDADLGIGLTFADNMVKHKNLVARIAAIRIRRRTAAEEMRILYVGMTRARERLIMIGAVKSIDLLNAFSQDGATANAVKNASCYMKWLCCALVDANGGFMRKGIFPAAPNAQASRDKAGRMAFLASSERIGTDALSPVFDFEYAYPSDTRLPSKLSVTELSGREVIIAQAPDFAMETVLTPRLAATKRGSATHALLEYVDFAADASEQALKARLGNMLSRGIIDEDELELADTKMVLSFLNSPLCARMKSASKIYRELEFNFNIPASVLMPNANTDEPILLQGVIDCCFLDADGEFVIIDYKTDKVLEGDTLETTAKRHQKQLELYSMALEKLAAAHVKERYVFMLRYGESVKI